MDGATSSLHSREGVTWGEPLYMVYYGIWVLLMIKLLKAAYTDVTQTWYVDDVGALGTFNNIGLYLIR